MNLDGSDTGSHADMANHIPIARRVRDALTMFVVSGLSLLLLMYVAFGEGQRTFQQFHLEKLIAQGRVVQSAINNFLRPGLPLDQYVGFNTRAGTIMSSDPAIAAIVVFDQNGRAVFGVGDKSIPLLSEAGKTAFPGDSDAETRLSTDLFQAVLPLRNRYEVVGNLAVSMPRSIVAERVLSSFEPLIVLAGVLSAVFGIIVSLARRHLRHRRIPWLQIIFGLTFLTMACFVIGTLVNLYSVGTQAKTKALADSLGQRLTDIAGFNLNIGEIRGLDKIFDDYRELNPDITAAGLIVNNKVTIHTDPKKVGTRWISNKQDYEYTVDITPDHSLRDIKVTVALPISVVFRQIVRSVKNFAALFVASAFFAGVFLQMAGSVQRLQDEKEHDNNEELGHLADESSMRDVKPVFFVAVFVEHLMYSFLPQYVDEVVGTWGLSSSLVSAPFMAYYLFFALSLLPAGHYAQQHNPKPLIYGGLFLAAAGIAVLTMASDFTQIMIARSLAGIGQGMLFIGVQSYILMTASPDRKTQGASIIVFGFQGGMISGMAIGSLLVAYLGPHGVFTLASAIAFGLAIYTLILIPAITVPNREDLALGLTWRQLGSSLAQMLRSLEFLKTMLLIGIPTKAVLTGIIIFALPLLLAKKGLPQEDIGQIIMVYAGGVIIASSYVSRLVDRIGHTHSVLFWGSIISGVGLMVVGLIDWTPISGANSSWTPMMGALIAGVATIGVAHGFINAPVVTHVAESDFGNRIGKSAATATYRFLERVGHIAGPIIVGQFFLIYGQDAGVLTWVGIFVCLAGLLFISLYRQPQTQTTNEEKPV